MHVNGSQCYGQLFDIIECTVLNFKPSPSGGYAAGNKQCLKNVLSKRRRKKLKFYTKNLFL